MTSMNDPVSQFCDAAMRAFANASQSAAPSSAFAQARAQIGQAAYLDVAVAGLRRHVKRVLGVEREQTLEAVSGPMGGVAAQAVLAEVVQGALADVIAAAQTSRPAGLR